MLVISLAHWHHASKRDSVLANGTVLANQRAALVSSLLRPKKHRDLAECSSILTRVWRPRPKCRLPPARSSSLSRRIPCSPCCQTPWFQPTEWNDWARPGALVYEETDAILDRSWRCRWSERKEYKLQSLCSIFKFCQKKME